MKGACVSGLRADPNPNPSSFSTPVQASTERSGTSINAIMKYITKKYVMLDLDQRKFHLRKAMKRLVEKGMVKQVKHLLHSHPPHREWSNR